MLYAVCKIYIKNLIMSSQTHPCFCLKLQNRDSLFELYNVYIDNQYKRRTII